MDYDETVFGNKPDLTYNLDEYRQFLTIREVLLEYVNCVRNKKTDGVPQLFVRKEQESYNSSWPAMVLIDGMPVGAALCALRHDYVEGCATSPVGYLEGVAVREAFRERGIARSLVSECEQWAREKGCTEFASDCELTNAASLRFHLSVGFSEENRIICFKKML